MRMLNKERCNTEDTGEEHAAGASSMSRGASACNSKPSTTLANSVECKLTVTACFFECGPLPTSRNGLAYSLRSRHTSGVRQ